MTKPKMRPCPSCQSLNQANRKTCSSCLCRLQVKHHLQKRQAAIQSSNWVDSVKKHRNSSRIVTSAQLSVLKLHELGYRPVLFIGQKDRKGHMVADVIHQVDQRQGPVLEILMKMTRLYEDLLRNVQQLLVTDEGVPPQQQDWIPSLDQADADPPHIKEEREEADVARFPFTRVPVGSEADNEKPQSSQLRPSRVEGDGEADPEADPEVCGGPQLYRTADPQNDVKASDSSEAETDDGLKEGGELQSSLGTVKNNEALASGPCEKPCSCSECGRRLYSKYKLKDHRRIHTGEKPLGCSACGRRFISTGCLKRHTTSHRKHKRCWNLNLDFVGFDKS